jgi:hypothetical protein
LAFRDAGLISVTISEGVKIIEISAFQRNANLTSLVLPESLTDIGAQAFAECGKLMTVTCMRASLPTFFTDKSVNNSQIIFTAKTGPTDNSVLLVPSGSEDTYRVSKQWGDAFKTITALP